MRFTVHGSRFENKAQMAGFTIIETLVAITILMIAIAGPLTVANQALHAALDAKNEMIASNLAQETVEEIRSDKDNKINSAPQYSTLYGIFGGVLDSSTKYGVQVSQDPGTSFTIGSCTTIGGDANCDLYLDPDYGYTYDKLGSDPITAFRRWFSFSPIGDPTTATEYILTVNVAWSNGAVPNQIQVQDLLSNANR